MEGVHGVFVGSGNQGSGRVVLVVCTWEVQVT